MQRVWFIRRAQDAGLALRQIGELLASHDGAAAPCRQAASLVDRRLAEVTGRLAELRETQVALRLAALDPADCDTAVICSALTPATDTPPDRPPS